MVLAVTMTAFRAEAETWHVYPDGSGNTPTIQSAVDSAISGDVILVAAGVYHQGDIVIDGKVLTIDQNPQAYLLAPSFGNGTGITIRNVSGFTLNSLTFRGFETAVALENASGFIQYITVKACARGITISGASSAPTVWFCVVDSCGTGVEVQGGGPVLLQNETIVNCSTGARFLGGSTTFTRNIVYHASTGMQCSGGSVIGSCNDFYLNTLNYGGCTPGTNDFYLNPMFCFWKTPAPSSYWLHVASPCFVTVSNPCGVRVGAFTSAAGCSGTATEHTTWGAIKDIYR